MKTLPLYSRWIKRHMLLSLNEKSGYNINFQLHFIACFSILLHYGTLKLRQLYPYDASFLCYPLQCCVCSDQKNFRRQNLIMNKFWSGTAINGRISYSPWFFLFFFFFFLFINCHLTKQIEKCLPVRTYQCLQNIQLIYRLLCYKFFKTEALGKVSRLPYWQPFLFTAQSHTLREFWSIYRS